MEKGDNCEADRTLPDGNVQFNINNCGSYDVFECRKSGKYFVIC